MKERTIEVTKEREEGILLESKYGNIFFIPESELDDILEDIKNLR